MPINARDVTTFGYLEIIMLNQEFVQNVKVPIGIDLENQKNHESYY